jgi:hypothetical protein
MVWLEYQDGLLTVEANSRPLGGCMVKKSLIKFLARWTSVVVAFAVCCTKCK